MSHLYDDRADLRSMKQCWSGWIATDAADMLDDVWVVIPDLDENIRVGPCTWQSRDYFNMPKRGDECLVIFDTDNRPWISVWWPSDGGMDPPATGGGGGVNTGHWQWDTSTTVASNRHVGINTANWATATSVNISETDINGSDMANYLSLLQPGDTLYLQPSADSSRWGRYKVTSAGTDQGTYRSIPVTYIDSAGGMPGNNNDMSVSLRQPGTPGPPGPPGPPAPTYVHTQSSPSATWIVTHSLGQFPSVTVIDTGDSVIIPSVHYDSSNQVTISFGSATSGKAYLN